MTDMIDTSAPERIWAAPSPHGAWAEAYAGDWRSPAKPKDYTRYVRADLYDALRHRAERARSRIDAVESMLEDAIFLQNDLRQRAEKADEYHAIANAYAAWAGDVLDAIDGRIGKLDPDTPGDQHLLSLLNRYEAGIAAETRRYLRQDNEKG